MPPYIGNAIDNALFEEKKEMLLVEQQGLCHKTNDLSNQREAIFRKVNNYLGLAKSLKNSFISGIPDEKRRIIKYVTSDLTIQGKKPMITMKSPFYEIANRAFSPSSDLNRNIPWICSPEIAKNYNFRSEPVDSPELRARMKELLDRILWYFDLHVANGEEGES